MKEQKKKQGSLADAAKTHRRRLHDAPDLRRGVSAAKATVPIGQIAHFINELAKTPIYTRAYAPEAFPISLAAMKPGFIARIASLERELVWTAAILKTFEAELSRFVQLEAQFNERMFAAQFEQAQLVLEEIEHLFGHSLWVISSRLWLLQESQGLEAQKEFRDRILEQKTNGVTSYIAFYLSVRIETTVTSSKYVETIEDLNETFGKHEALKSYCCSHLLLPDRLDVERFNEVIGYEENSPIIDRYLTFLLACQRICVEVASGRSDLLQLVTGALQLSALSVQDYRLENLKYVCGLGAPVQNIDPTEAIQNVFDEYTRGNYAVSSVNSADQLSRSAMRAELYEIHVLACARAGEADQYQKREDTLLWRVISAMFDVHMKNNRYAESLETLEKLAMVCKTLPISAQISAFLSRNRTSADTLDLAATDIYACLCCPAENPWQHRAFKAINPALQVSQDLFSFYQNSPTLQLEALLAETVGDADLLVRNLDRIPMPEDRRETYSARIFGRAGRLEESIALYERRIVVANGPNYFETARRLSNAYLEVGDQAASLELAATVYLRNPLTYEVLPIPRLLREIEDLDFMSFAKSPALAIIYDAYSRHIGTDRDGPKSDAYEDFLTSRGLTRPSELRAIAFTQGNQDREKLVYFLRHVCVPRVMDASTVFGGTKDLLLERIAVCQLLTELDPRDDSLYEDEIRAITQEIVVGDRVREVDQSRIYVDVDSIRETLDRSMAENFTRYISIVASKSSEPGEHEQLISKVIEIIAQTRVEAEILKLPANERDNLFDAMFQEFRNQFVTSSVHGLAAYLSGRVRHGILRNHLRSPLEIQHLATQKNGVTEIYYPNTYWVEQYPDLPSEEADRLSERLASFTKEVDELIDTVNQKWIQIRRESSTDGMFVFNTLNVRRRQLQSQVNVNTSYEEFIDMMFRFFWGVTEDSLTEIREKFDTVLKPAIFGAFDKLQLDVAEIRAKTRTPELDAAITAARIDMQAVLEKVKDWFKLSKATEKPDYDVETLVNVAVQSTNNCFRHSPLRPTTSLDSHVMLKGATLTNLVEILYIFLSNVILRSGFIGASPSTKLAATIGDDDQLVIIVENEVSFEDETARLTAQERLAAAHLAQQVDEQAGNLVVREGGTGFAKVRKILRHDLACDHELTFGFTSDRTFSVRLSLDVSSHVVSK
jgi:tetratricopeptide (TPR) repeat protein